MNEISTALYRKYRPQTFEDVRNQDHIVNVLKGAIKKQSIPHALLFTGSRGTGKTTVARIFAREVGAHEIDTYEIDAASNRGIDDIRALKESVHTLPYESAYKVYIIDEVHMLTKEAFNALLKTLEEPPAHVIFILATTEKDRLLDTITSRCQVFEFRSPGRDELREAVLKVAKQEKFKLTAPGADVIALAAAGSYRDAFGITQKIILASNDTELSPDEIAEIVGAPKTLLLNELLTAFAKKDLERGLGALQSATISCTDPTLLYTLLLERVRAVILLRHSKKLSEIYKDQFDPETYSRIEQYAQEGATAIHSHLLIQFLEMGTYMGRNDVGFLPIEVVLLEECAK